MGFLDRAVNRRAAVKMKANVTWWMEAVHVVMAGRDLGVKRGFVSGKSCMAQSARLYVPVIKTTQRCK